MPLKTNDQIIEQVSTNKYLGVTIEEKLSSDHINNIKSKASKRLYFVRGLSQFKVDKALITLFYKSVIDLKAPCRSVLLFEEGTVRKETV